jgi:hypothetical protein
VYNSGSIECGQSPVNSRRSEIFRSSYSVGLNEVDKKSAGGAYDLFLKQVPNDGTVVRTVKCFPPVSKLRCHLQEIIFTTNREVSEVVR